MRLIDADKLNRKKKYSFPTQGGVFPKSEWFIKVRDVFTAPTVDAVPVVRCKNCKHVMLAEGGTRFCMVWHGVTGMGDDGFCFYGEREGGE